jgi:hypothetical protein
MHVAVERPGMSEVARLAAYSTVSTSLALRSDRQLAKLVDAAVPLGSGIGGRSALLEIGGKPVFVKRVPLTDMELLPEHVRSTGNLFGLPTFCQYGVGGPGPVGPSFGAWRELAVHTMTTNWVLGRQYQGFPLMYHWRVLPDTSALTGELPDVEPAVDYWGGGPEVRRRIEALQQSSEERCALIRACAEGEDPLGGPQEARAILSRHAPLAAVMTDFYGKVQDESRQTPYPLEALRRALDADRSRRG